MKSATEEKISQIQLIEQGMQSILAQKQQFQSQLLEIESAAKELATTGQAYKIVGNIMIRKDKKALEEETQQKLDRVRIRLKAIEKQEERSKEKMKALQDEVMAAMKK